MTYPDCVACVANRDKQLLQKNRGTNLSNEGQNYCKNCVSIVLGKLTK